MANLFLFTEIVQRAAELVLEIHGVASDAAVVGAVSQQFQVARFSPSGSPRVSVENLLETIFRDDFHFFYLRSQ